MKSARKAPGASDAALAATVFFDGACPICSLEMCHLAEREEAAALKLIDISAPGFDARQYGFTADALDAEIHAIGADGSVLRGMAALRLAYATAGLGWVLRPTGFFGLRPMFDAAYRVFARHRRPISRALAPLIARVAAWRERQGKSA